MKASKVWVITLDFTNMDGDILKYTKFLGSILHPKELHFVHVVSEAEMPSYLPEEFLELRNQVIVDERLRLESKVDKYFKDAKIKYECHVQSGVPIDEVIDLVIQKDAEMVIAGRKKSSSGSGIVSDRIARSLPCDFLLIPEGFEPQIKNILLTTDFSEHSNLALDKAVELKNSGDVISIIACHCYSVPVGYSKSGKTFDEFADIMKVNAEKEMRRWLDGHKSVRTVLKLKDKKSFSDNVLETAKENKVDLLIIGSKGQSIGSLALLGSNTLKVLRVNETIPLLIVKKAGENMNFIDALKRV